LILLTDETYAWISGYDIRDIIGRTIIDDDQLKVFVTLAEDALNRFSQEVRIVVAGYNN
jgi:hypothetical protein